MIEYFVWDIFSRTLTYSLGVRTTYKQFLTSLSIYNVKLSIILLNVNCNFNSCHIYIYI